MWLLPTRQRLVKLQRMLYSAIETKASTPCVMIVSKEEWARDGAEYEKLVKPEGWEFYISDGDTMGDKIQDYWVKHRYTHPWFGSLNDDFYCVTPEWDKKLLKHLDLDTIGMISSNDGWQSPTRCHGAFVADASFLNALGYYYPMGLQHSYIDDMFEILGSHTRCWHVDMDVILEHRHKDNPKATGNEMDSTYQRSKDLFEEDKKIFSNWLSQDALGACNRIGKWQIMKKYKIPFIQEF